MICSLSFMFAALLSGCGGEIPSYGLDGSDGVENLYEGTQVGNTGVTTFVFLADGSVNCKYKGFGLSPGLVLQGRADSNSPWVFMGQSPVGVALLTISLDLFPELTQFECNLFEEPPAVESASIASPREDRAKYNQCRSADLDEDGSVTPADEYLMWYALKYHIGYLHPRFDVDGDGEMGRLDLAMVQDCLRWMPPPGGSITIGGVQP